MTPPITRSALSALSAHRFLMRAALSATFVFTWVFALQYLYALYGNITEAFVRVILLYELSQVVTILLTPYAARELQHGIRGRMMAGVVVCILGFSIFGGTLVGLFNGPLGLLCFALFMGAYRAIYWTPYVLEKSKEISENHIPQEIFIALMPMIAGLTLLNGPLGAAVLVFSGATILIASLSPLFYVPEMYEKYSWSYRETFAELFEPKYNILVEPSFVEGLQGTALLLLWPLSVFIIAGLSYSLLGLILSATLLLAMLLRSRVQKVLEGKDMLRATMAATAWVLRLTVASPATAVLVAAYATPADASVDLITHEQSADNGTYLDEYTVLKEIAQGFGRIAMCIVAAVCISVFSLPVGLGVTFVLAGAASMLGFLRMRRERAF